MKLSQAIKRHLKRLIKNLFKRADAVVCNTVDAVQLAEYDFFLPEIIAIDEGALQPEVDIITIWEYYPKTPVFLSSGAYWQGNILLLSADLGAINDVYSNLLIPKVIRMGVETLLADEAYRAGDEIASFKQPFAEQFRTSRLKRVALKASGWASELVINHRNKAGTHAIAAAIAYNDRMLSQTLMTNAFWSH